MRKFSRVLIAGAAAAVALTAGAGGATAKITYPDGTDSETAVINGREFGPKDGLTVDVQQFEVTPGGDPVGAYFPTTPPAGMITPMATWGASYATSTETVQLYYTGRAKAAGNVFNQERIVQVCFWYTRGGNAISSKYCSNASSTGSAWLAGPEVSHGVWDSLIPGDSNRTIFNISVSRINPNVY